MRLMIRAATNNKMQTSVTPNSLVLSRKLLKWGRKRERQRRLMGIRK
jgi:hypothetical protein